MFNNKTKYALTNDDIESVVAELFTGGIETVSVTMHLTLAKLGSHKALQDEIYDEIKRHLTPGHNIDETLLANVKHLKAFVKEVLRFFKMIKFSVSNSIF